MGKEFGGRKVLHSPPDPPSPQTLAAHVDGEEAGKGIRLENNRFIQGFHALAGSAFPNSTFWLAGLSFSFSKCLIF